MIKDRTEIVNEVYSKILKSTNEEIKDIEEKINSCIQEDVSIRIERNIKKLLLQDFNDDSALKKIEESENEKKKLEKSLSELQKTLEVLTHKKTEVLYI